MNKLLSLFSFCLILIFIISCAKDEDQQSLIAESPNLPETVFSYTMAENQLPELSFDNTPDDNHITDHGATLGRVLFYDPKLSINNAISCASCHRQELAFTDGEALSLGFESKRTKRNSPTVMNMRFSRTFFWDLSQSELESQVVMPIGDHIEMGMEDQAYLHTKLAQTDYYPELFENAFGTETVTQERISKALSQFIRSVNSFDSSFDIGRTSSFDNFNSLELHGLEVFLKSNCNNCHQVISHGVIINGSEIELEMISESTPYSGGSSSSQNFANIGLDLEYADEGRGEGKFKIPTLRNLTYTAPYMHDGRFKTLEDVIEHYNSGVRNHTDLDSRLKEGGDVMRLDLDEIEKRALKAFLLTLTDDSIITDEKLSDPFKL